MLDIGGKTKFEKKEKKKLASLYSVIDQKKCVGVRKQQRR